MKKNPQLKKYFDELHEIRLNLAKGLTSAEFKETFNGVIHKYRESAHFIYELLQNADDAKASKVQMILEHDKFIFIHDGTERFTVSNPQTPEEDKKAGKYGHINSITAVGFSTKNGPNNNDAQGKIGKFGVGFKAIFEYTTTPYIYDDPFCFKIEHYIVPTEVNDKTYYKKGKTVFVIPFDRTDITQDRSYKEIEQKILTLENPLLFLRNLESIVWSTPLSKGRIHKKVISSYPTMYTVTPTLYSLTNSSNTNAKVLLLNQDVFIPFEGKHTIAIGYFLDSKGRLNTRVRPKIHCFFPTTESIDTCFIIHAPFLLVDNREQIKRNDDTNTALFAKIGKLAAQSLLILRDISVSTNNFLLNDNILELIHFDLTDFSPNRFSFNLNVSAPDYNQYFSDVYMKEKVFLSRSGNYISRDEGRWSTGDLQNLLTKDQLSSLLLSDNEKNIRDFDFILCSVNSKRMDEILLLQIKQFGDSNFAFGLTADFMSKQSNEWINAFYNYVLTKRLVEKYELRKGKWSDALMRYKPILKNQEGGFIAPYTGQNLNVFYITDGSVPLSKAINTDMLLSCPSLHKILSILEIKKPSEFDIIRIRIESQHTLDKGQDNQLLLDILRLYKGLPQNELDSLIRLIKEKYLFACKTLFANNKTVVSKKTSSNICQNIDDLKVYFKVAECQSKYFLDIRYYEQLIQNSSLEDVNDFFLLLSFQSRPYYILEEDRLSDDENKQKPHYRICTKRYTNIEEISTVLPIVSSSKKYLTMSHYIWKLLCYYIDKEPNLLINDYSEYYLRRDKIHSWPYCSLKRILLSNKWIYIDGTKKNISNKIYIEDFLRNGYENNTRLFQELGIESSPKVKERESISHMSAETNAIFSLGEIARSLGVHSQEEMKLLIKAGFDAKKKEQERKDLNERRIKEHKELLSMLPQRKKEASLSAQDFKTPNNDRAKSANRVSKTVEVMNLEEVLSGFEEKINLQKQEFEEVLSLREMVRNTEKYSFQWMKALMELETKSQGKTDANGKKAIFLAFNDVVAEHQADNLIILRGASRNIPSIIEDIDEIPINFYYKDGQKVNIIFDVASVKDDYLILKGNSKHLALIKKIKEDANRIYKATLEVERPIELIKYWENLIQGLDLTEDTSLKSNLRTDLDFIFGPPGTGKTTELAKRIIKLIQQSKGKCKILVLAPTNKACDVLTEKILDHQIDDDTWLWRFVSTMSERIEREELVYDRSSDIAHQKKVCVISTMARYSFDGFDTGLLNQIEWDYLIIDEASMIPLYQIIPPLYNKNCKSVLIAGDPFQIEPIVHIDEWKGENIYSLINLHDFVAHTTEPVQFNVETLMTQYRSIPAIGEIYSQYMYGGKLRHNKSSDDHKVLNMGLSESPLNIISYPISKETIFETKHLGYSNIHIYSVIFTVEFIKYLADKISTSNQNDSVRIGVLSPYGAEVQAIQKMFNQSNRQHENIEVICGTSHGFQGDECDIVVVVMNPPASGLKRTADLTFINKANILNVAISRAKDYLFVLIPSKEYECFDSLYEIKRLGRIMSAQKCKFYSSDDLEKLMFGQVHYIENNTFVTTHQTTNVYSDPFAKYEIRIDDTAMDIQINDEL